LKTLFGTEIFIEGITRIGIKNLETDQKRQHQFRGLHSKLRHPYHALQFVPILAHDSRKKVWPQIYPGSCRFQIVWQLASKKPCSSGLHRSAMSRYLPHNLPLGFSIACLTAVFAHRMYRQKMSLPFVVMEESGHSGTKSLQPVLMIDQDCKFNPQETTEEQVMKAPGHSMMR
jgi:hypothetical protein